MRLCLTLALALLAAAPLPSLTADQIARQIQDRDTGRDSRADLRMKLFDRRDRLRERALTLVTLRGREAPGAPKTAPDGDRLLIRFTYPNDIRGTSFLVGSTPAEKTSASSTCRRSGGCAASPALRRRRASSAATSRTRTLAAVSWRISPRACSTRTPCGPRPTAPPGRPTGWNRKRKDRAAEFPRVVSLVLKDSFLVVQADVHNRRDEKQKVYSVRRIQQTQGIWNRSNQSSMTNALDRTRTELAVEKIEYNIGLKEDAFSRRVLEGAAR